MIGVLRDLRDSVGAVVFGGIVVGSAIVVIGGLTYGGIEIGNWLTSSTAVSTGNAQVKHDTYSGANQEQVSGTFSQLHEQIAQYQDQIAQAKKADGASPSNLQAMQLTALEETCSSAVQQYNSDVETNTMGGLLPAGWPTSYPYDTCH